MSIFQKIIAGEIPAKMLHDDEHCIAIADINPQAPVHLLVIPKKLIPRIGEAAPEDKEVLAHLLQVAAKLGNEMGPMGYRIVINNGSQGGESVPHLHIHVLAGRQLAWPPG